MQKYILGNYNKSEDMKTEKEKASGGNIQEKD